MTQNYITKLDLVDSDVQLNHVPAIMEKLREWGHPEILWGTTERIPIAIEVTYEVGDKDGIEDLWELRGMIDEIETDLLAYMHSPTLPKPTLVED